MSLKDLQNILEEKGTSFKPPKRNRGVSEWHGNLKRKKVLKNLSLNENSVEDFTQTATQVYEIFDYAWQRYVEALDLSLKEFSKREMQELILGFYNECGGHLRDALSGLGLFLEEIAKFKMPTFATISGQGDLDQRLIHEDEEKVQELGMEIDERVDGSVSGFFEGFRVLNNTIFLFRESKDKSIRKGVKKLIEMRKALKKGVSLSYVDSTKRGSILSISDLFWEAY